GIHERRGGEGMQQGADRVEEHRPDLGIDPRHGQARRPGAGTRPDFGPGSTALGAVGPIGLLGGRTGRRAGCFAPSGRERPAWAATATFSTCTPPRNTMNPIKVAGAASKMRLFSSSPYVFQKIRTPNRIRAHPAISRLQ